MANKDWDLDDLLDFHYEHKVPEKNNDFDILDELNGMAKPAAPVRPRPVEPVKPTPAAPVRPRPAEPVRPKPATPVRPEPVRGSGGSFSAYDPNYIEPPLHFDFPDDQFPDDQFPQRRRPVEEVNEPREHRKVREIPAIKQASQEAYDRYRSNYTKKKQREQRKGQKRVTGFDRFLTLIYLIAFGTFAASMLFMNVLPAGMTFALFGILILLSLVILIQTRKKSIKTWGKRLATLLAVLLIGFYGVGTAYALGTLSFLSGSSVDNPNAVADVTKQPFNFIITGIDVDGTIDEQGRSDVNMVVTVNPKTHQILMTSIPRDYEIYMAEFDNDMDKLTHTGFYGVQTTIDAEEQLLDTKINYYVKVNFTTVERFIDAVGGVDVESEYEFNPVKMKDWTVQVGMNHMNGKQALAFARERKAFPTGDNQRIKNQQLVFEALIKKATSSRTMILNYNKVLTSLTNYFEMSFSSREIRKLVKYQISHDPDWHIFKNTIVGGDGLLPTHSTGGEYAYVMTQDEASIENAKTLINAVLDGQILTTDEDGNVTVVPEDL